MVLLAHPLSQPSHNNNKSSSAMGWHSSHIVLSSSVKSSLTSLSCTVICKGKLICSYTHNHTCTHAHTLTHTHTHTCTDTHMHAHRHRQTDTHVHAYTHTLTIPINQTSYAYLNNAHLSNIFAHDMKIHFNVVEFFPVNGTSVHVL